MEVEVGNVDDAIQYARESGYTYYEDGEMKRYKMNVDNKIFETFGIGVFYYVDYLKSFALVFFIMSLVMLPVIVLNNTLYTKEETSGDAFIESLRSITMANLKPYD